MLLLLLACLDPAPAIELCQANPGLHSDPASVAAWSPLLDPEEFDVVRPILLKGVFASTLSCVGRA